MGVVGARCPVDRQVLVAAGIVTYGLVCSPFSGMEGQETSGGLAPGGAHCTLSTHAPRGDWGCEAKGIRPNARAMQSATMPQPLLLDVIQLESERLRHVAGPLCVLVTQRETAARLIRQP